MVHFLMGYKTYILAAVAALGAFLQALGLISRESWDTLIAILVPLVVVTLRSAVSEVKQDVDKVQTSVVVQAMQVKEKVQGVQTAVVEEVVAVGEKVQVVEAKVEHVETKVNEIV